MTRRLGGIERRRGLAALASLSLATVLAGGGAVVGCGGDDSTTQPSGTDSGVGVDSSTTVDSGIDTGIDTGTGFIDTGTGPVDTGIADVPVPKQLMAPTFTPTAPASILVGTTVSITCPDLPMTGNGFIFYTLDNTLPTHTSPAYSGPIQINSDSTIHAMCSDTVDGYTDSQIVSGKYTVTTPPVETSMPPAPPQFNPPAGKVNNDFNLALSDPSNNAIICYTKDSATVPACNAAATGCSSGTLYNGGTPIRIDGTVTDTTGNVTVQAIACAAGTTGPSMVISQLYTLQVAAPTMVNPTNAAALVFGAGGNTPTISSTTLPTNTSNVSFWVGTGTTMPTCVTGTQVANPYQLGSSGAIAPVTANSTYNVIGCKANYAPSAVTPFSYTVQLNAPAYTQPAGTYDGTIGNNVDDSKNGGSSDWLCWSSDPAKVATCDTTTANKCAVGNAITAANSGVAGEPVNVTKTGQSFTTQACSLFTNNSGYLPSPAPTPAAYTLKLDPLFLDKPGVGKNQYTFLGTDTNPKPVTIGQNTPAANPIAAEPVNTAGYVCAGDKTVATVDCTCNTAATAHLIKTTVTAALAATPTGNGSQWSLIACSSDLTTFANSDPFTVTYAPVGAATSPQISPVTGLYNFQVGTQNPANTPPDIALTLTNQDLNASTLCFTADGTAPSATCTAGGSTICSGAPVNPTAKFNVTFPSNAIQGDNTVITAIACNGAETATPTPTTAKYNFQLLKPTFTLVKTNPVTGDENAGGAIGGGQQITIATASDFTNEFVNYTLVAGATATPATCATGAPNQKVTGPITIPTNMTGTISVDAIACGTTSGPYTQQSSGRQTATFTLANAPPDIVNSATNKVGDLTWENTFSATITSVTPGAAICYTNAAGDDPVCSAAGACTHGISVANGATVNITTSGTAIHAIACSAALPVSAESKAAYTLQMSPLVAPDNSTCPETFALGLSQVAADVALGGPTPNAMICWSTTGVTPNTDCSAKAGTTCFSTGADGKTPTPAGNQNVPNLDTSSGIIVHTCSPANTAFVQPANSITSLTVAPFTSDSNGIMPPGITVEGTFSPGEWPATAFLPDHERAPGQLLAQRDDPLLRGPGSRLPGRRDDVARHLHR